MKKPLLLSLVLMSLALAMAFLIVWGTAIQERRVAAYENTLKGFLFSLYKHIGAYEDKHGIRPARIITTHFPPDTFLHSWRAALVTQFGATNAYDFHKSWSFSSNQQCAKEVGRHFCPIECTNNGNPPKTRFVALADPRAVFSEQSRTFPIGRLPDGAANTLMLIDLPEAEVEVFEPEDVSFTMLQKLFGNQLPLSSRRERRALLFCDGKIFWQTAPISLQTLHSLSTCDGNENVLRSDLVKNGILKPR